MAKFDFETVKWETMLMANGEHLNGNYPCLIPHRLLLLSRVKTTTSNEMPFKSSSFLPHIVVASIHGKYLNLNLFWNVCSEPKPGYRMLDDYVLYVQFMNE